MAATRLTDSQKSEVVARFRAGAATQELAEAFGCSANTVSRIVKAALDPADYESLKQQRGGRRGARPDGGEAVIQGDLEPLPLVVVAPPIGFDDEEDVVDEEDVADEEIVADEEDVADDEDEYVDVDEEDFLAEEEDEDDEGGDDDFLPIPVALALDDHAPREPVPLAAASLPASVYMLVDKTVELQARPLSDFPELGRLPQEEQQRQALVVFANPRQAKRQCGRSQRVIKVPDARVLERTAAYLLAQGISRVVIEGALYSLPGS
jgi:hypothetical protein